MSNVTRSRYLTLAEAKRLINASDPEFRVLVRAALETGARYQEFARLRVRDFNPDSGTLHIRKSKVHKDRHIVLTEEGQELFGNLAAESQTISKRRWWRPASVPRSREHRSIPCVIPGRSR